ncbi:glucokinase [Roseovarius gahaiensis]|uniref:Glucokinase n=2 Tax=Roseovarius gahaiensis TaxID=2716691 RepID=A0A967BFV6_9RHOB|nr:glucokinase [Roseovarius gahaiensis]NHQ75850.1 glucokinase [Roseovarius gahaiensis]
MGKRHLLADVGGTHTRIGLTNAQGRLCPDSARRYRTADFSGLAAALAFYLRDLGCPSVAGVCAGVAGPVGADGAQLTNLDWFIAPDDLRAATGAAQVHLLNDLQAQAYALDDLDDAALVPVVPGRARPDGARLVLGVGTGCNVAVAHRIGDDLFVPPAESGHTGLPHGEAQINALVDHMSHTHPHKPIEAVLSGPGLLRLHHWLGGTASDIKAIIAQHRTGQDGTAAETMRVFARLVGTVAGDMCLHHMATGGLYLIGGVARAVAPHLASLGMQACFVAKGPYRQILQDIPITLIDDDTAALKGCARFLRQIPRATSH